MKNKTFEEINQIYEIDIEKIVNNIKKNKAKIVLLQFPEGMKSYAQKITDEIENKSKCNCLIWMGSCFGACDLPIEVERLGVEMIIHFGHSPWGYRDVNEMK